MKKTNTDAEIDFELASIRRAALKLSAELREKLTILEECLNEGRFPVWVQDIEAGARSLLLLTAQNSILLHVKQQVMADRRFAKQERKERKAKAK